MHVPSSMETSCAKRCFADSAVYTSVTGTSAARFALCTKITLSASRAASEADMFSTMPFSYMADIILGSSGLRLSYFPREVALRAERASLTMFSEYL